MSDQWIDGVIVALSVGPAGDPFSEEQASVSTVELATLLFYDGKLKPLWLPFKTFSRLES